MKLRKRSDARENIEDRRGQRVGMGGGLPIPGGAIKGGIPALIIAVVLMLIGGRALNGGGGGGSGLEDLFPQLNAAPEQGSEAPPDVEEEEMVDWTGTVFNDVQDFWDQTFSASGSTYEYATLVIFEDAVQSGCGTAPASAGPFYCPLDKKVYLDLSFFRQLEQQFDAPGDFAAAYVIAHEVGHHIQNLTGVNPEVRRLQQENPSEANELSVKQELQADCLAGVWGYTIFDRNLLEPGDVEEALGAATAVGDDTIQENAGMDINPETWTHGSSEQRVEWFNRGFESGDPGQCNTFD